MTFLVHILRHENFSGFCHILTQFTRCIHLSAKYIRISEFQNFSIPKSDAYMYFIFWFLVSIEHSSDAIHLNSRLDGVFWVSENHEETIPFELQDYPSFLLDDGSEYKL